MDVKNKYWQIAGQCMKKHAADIPTDGRGKHETGTRYAWYGSTLKTKAGAATATNLNKRLSFGAGDNYLDARRVGRYIRRGPISERRIIGYDGKTVTIGYAHKEKHDKSSFTLTAPQFIARLLAHVPEKGTHVARNYGLFHPRCREKLNLARKHLDQGPYVPSMEVADAIEILIKMFPDQDIGQCPICRQRLRTVFIYRGGRAPRWQLAA